MNTVLKKVKKAQKEILQLGILPLLMGPPILDQSPPLFSGLSWRRPPRCLHLPTVHERTSFPSSCVPHTLPAPINSSVTVLGFDVFR